MNKERRKRLVEGHTTYITKTLKKHGTSAKEIDLITYHYSTAFKHGYKHGYDDKFFEELDEIIKK